MQNKMDECVGGLAGRPGHQGAPGSIEADRPLQLQYSTLTDESQEMSLSQMFRLRDALIALERRVIEARQQFEAEIAEILGGEGDD